jgi:hypothetical protein
MRIAGALDSWLLPNVLAIGVEFLCPLLQIAMESTLATAPPSPAD